MNTAAVALLLKILSFFKKISTIKTPSTIVFDEKNNIPVEQATTTISFQGVDAATLNTSFPYSGNKVSISAAHTFRDNGAADVVVYNGTNIPHGTFDVTFPDLLELSELLLIGGNLSVTYNVGFSTTDGVAHRLIIKSGTVVVPPQIN